MYSGNAETEGGNETIRSEATAPRRNWSQPSVMQFNPNSDESRHFFQMDYLKEGLTVMVIGASGDLAKKKTFPALFDLYCNGFLPEHATLVGYSRSNMSDDDLRERIRPYVEEQATTPEQKEKVERFLKKCFYRRGMYGSEKHMSATIQDIEKWEAAQGFSNANRLFYFAIPPSVFVPQAAAIKAAGVSPSGWTRLIIEKPFGNDLASAEKMARELNAHFTERDIYRIDHYLGKEMVQNMMVFRFSNVLWERLWNRDTVDSVLITFKEPFGTEGRGGYFDGYGIVRDIMQNHLMQVLALLAMEPPTTLDGPESSDAIRDEKVLRAIPPIQLKDLVLGQYAKSEDGTKPAYTDDETVPEGSLAATFAQARPPATMYIKNKRWDGVPFIMKAGKALDERKAEIRIQFKPAPAGTFQFAGHACPRNEMVIRLQPYPGIMLKNNVKSPGLRSLPLQSELDLSYNLRYAGTYSPDAYTRLILDTLRGVQATFVREDELRESWKIFDPVLEAVD
ncbi:unnamed protein product, partial [Heterosigma akashiwo]